MSTPADRSRPRASVRLRVRRPNSVTAAEKLTDDLLIEILSRVPAKSLCRFKSVSKHWLSLINHPDHRKKLAQPLAGFFYSLDPPVLFASVPGSRWPLSSTSLAFLPNHGRIRVMDCCNGLLLCRWYGVSAPDDQFRYVVCNPATEKWVDFPNSGQAADVTRLGFDQAQSSHFHVFELVQGDGVVITDLDRVAVYSSETRGWVSKRGNRHFQLLAHRTEETVFLNGHLHFHSFDTGGGGYSVATVDTEGETRVKLAVPGGRLIDDFIQCSQGRLHYAHFYKEEEYGVIRLAVYLLDSDESKEWKLKHTVETSDLFRGLDVRYLATEFKWVGIHPECNVIFFMVNQGSSSAVKFVWYNMDRRQVKVICSLKDGKLPYLPYVPLYAGLQSLHM